jgi:NTP pyrophosphatase (non-canonical NTP hydrolase)
MTLTEYQEEAMKTDIRKQYAKVNLRLVCSVLGLIEEVEEYEKARNYKDIVSESGDILWYIASICKELDIDIEEINKQHTSSLISPAKIMKKTLRDYDGMMPEHYKQNMIDYMRVQYNRLHPFIVQGAMHRNIEKLQSRLQRNVITGDGDTR